MANTKKSCAEDCLPEELSKTAKYRKISAKITDRLINRHTKRAIFVIKLGIWFSAHFGEYDYTYTLVYPNASVEINVADYFKNLGYDVQSVHTNKVMGDGVRREVTEITIMW